MPKRKPRSAKKYSALRKTVKGLLHARVAQYAPLYGVSVRKIFVRNQKTRWGSCSSRGNLNFNWRVVHLPPPLLDYLVVHELCHLREFNHSPKFWELVATTIPEYKRIRKDLRGMPL